MNRDRLQKPSNIKAYLTFILFILLVWGSAVRVDADLGKLILGFPEMGRILREMWPPDWGYFTKIADAMLETIRMAILGTTFGAILAVPISLLSARNITRSPILYLSARLMMNLIRTIPNLLLAALFVAIFGIGPIAGIGALTLFSFGLIAKLTYESLETIETEPLEAMTAVGATKSQLIVFGVIPQILPQFISYVLFTFEVNIRAAAVLGLVGAGGIGLYYDRTLGLMQYERASSIILFTLAIVLLIDYFSVKIREKLI